MKHLREVSIDGLPKTAARTKSAFKRLGVETYFDLLQYYPQRYEDYSNTVKISEIPSLAFEEEDEFDLFTKNKFTIEGTITNYKNIFTRRGFKIQQITLEDESGQTNVSWFNQMYLSNILKPGSYISISGKLKPDSRFQRFQPESYEVLDSKTDKRLHTAHVVPVYGQTKGLSTKTIREKVMYVLDLHKSDIEEFLPKKIVEKHKLVPAEKAYVEIHRPTSKDALIKARERIAFDEIFALQMSSQYIRNEWNKEAVVKAFNFAKYKKEVQAFIDNQPFELTGAQKRVSDEIINDLVKESPMNRLLQGDVGCGKTIVAAIAMYVTKLNDMKTLFMAPTEILATQHYVSLKKTFAQADTDIAIEIVTSKNKPSKEDMDKADILVGTHALISKKTTVQNVGLVVVDEQHKFGVAQRAMLKEKGTHPHLLSMTATPIPRTVTLTLYGELDVSSIDEMPHGRKTVKTHLVPDKKREKAYEWIRDHMKETSTQTFIVCPLIKESEAESMQNIRAAEKEFENLAENEFKDLEIGLLHGKLKPAEKDEMMQHFLEKKIDVLVSTPVVEVGIDVPNATVIVIEAAERFGLAQLHQLRGRVGRSDKQSYCYLFTTEDNQINNRRLKHFEKEHDGFKLAQFDLEHRGSGSIFGTKQHGNSEMAFSAVHNLSLIRSINEDAQKFFDSYTLEDYPELKTRVHEYNVKRIARN